MDSISLIFIYWIIYAFIGWIVETVYCSIPAGKLMERGFLNGPIIPIYGFGAVIVLLALDPYIADVWMIFVLGMVLTTILEYITSYVMEKLFNMRWWDYSSKRFNINGRVCLLNSVLFGLLCVFVVEVLHPIIQANVLKIPAATLNTVAAVLFVIVIADTVYSGMSAMNLNKRFSLLADLRLRIDALIETMSDDQKEQLQELQNRLSKAKEEYKRGENRLLKAFPSLRSERFDEFIAEIKEHIQQHHK